MISIGFFQFSPQERTAEENIDFVISSLKRERNCLIVLPELFLQSYFDYSLLEQKKLPLFLKKLTDFSKKNELAFIGSLPISSGNYVANRSYYISNGIITRACDKRKLYSQEKKTFRPGSSHAHILRYKNLSFVACICLDVLDPLMARKALSQEADLLLVSATVSVDFLRTITKARALENQMVTVFANRSGIEKSGFKYLGCSAVFFPDGREQSTGLKENVFQKMELKKEDLEQMKRMRKELGIV
ncbi:MAG: carbon-nitrogen hydrolase family protein [Patescibacteria group bacterium]